MSEKATYPIRILQIDGKMFCGGVESFIMNMYRNMDRSIIQFDFLVHYSDKQMYDDEIERLGGKIHYLSVRNDNNFIKYYKDMDRIFRENNYLIVHGHMESFARFYLKSAKRNNVPVRIAHSHIARINYNLKGFLKYFLNKPVKRLANIRLACSSVAGKFLYGKKDFFVFNNAIELDKFRFSQVNRDKIRDMHNFSDKIVLGCVGRFEKQKNHIFLIRIMKELKKINSKYILLLFGTGKLEKKIRLLVSKYKLDDNVFFMGVKTNMYEYYSAIDCFIMPSLFEGLPVSGIEAQAAGLKCVFSTAVTKETNITNNNVFISLKKDASTWASQIDCLGLSSYLREDTTLLLKKAGFDIKDQAKKLQDYYVQLYNSNCNKAVIDYECKKNI